MIKIGVHDTKTNKFYPIGSIINVYTNDNILKCVVFFKIDCINETCSFIDIYSKEKLLFIVNINNIIKIENYIKF